jgi:hypothetical protein
VSKQRRYYTWNPGTGMAWGQDKLDLHVTPEREADQDRAHIVNVARDDIPRLIERLQRVHASMLDDDHWHSSVRRPASEAADRIGSAIVETMRNAEPATGSHRVIDNVTGQTVRDGLSKDNAIGLCRGLNMHAERLAERASEPHCQEHPFFRADCDRCLGAQALRYI